MTAVTPTGTGGSLDVPALRVVRALHQQGSFSGAARALGLSSAAVSQMVSRLERRCGTPVVERRARSVRLTDAGLALSRCAAFVLEELDATERELVLVQRSSAQGVGVASA